MPKNKKTQKAQEAVGQVHTTLAEIQERLHNDAEPLLTDLEERAARRAARRNRRRAGRS